MAESKPKLSQDFPDLRWECVNCQSDEFWLTPKKGKWIAVCEYCEDEYELLSGEMTKFIRHGRLD
jgi:hypothetical protein